MSAITEATIEQVVRRLKASKDEAMGEWEAVGTKDGQEWVTNETAGYEELSRLFEGYPTLSLDEDGDGLAELIDPHNTPGEFWQRAIGEERMEEVGRLPNPLRLAFYKGFALGAYMLFNAARERL